MTRLIVLSIICVLFGACAQDGQYPAREIRIIVHASPGGISDAVSRYVARELQAILGVPVVCENRVGASGSVALSYVAKSRPDGYTVGYAPVDMAIVPHLGYAQVKPDDFDFLVLHTRAPATVAVRTSAPWTTLDALVGAVRAKPMSVNMATSGTGSIWHLASLAFARKAGIQFNYVPYPGSGQAVTALLGGHVDAVVAGPAEVQPHVSAGTLRLLGVMAAQPSPIFPEVRTFKDQGYDVQIDAWGGFLVPKDTPADRRDKLIAAMRRVLDSDGFQRFCRERGLEIHQLAGGEFGAFVRREHASFATLVKDAGLSQ